MNWEGNRLKILMQKANLSMSETAEILNISKVAINKYVNANESPSFAVIEKMADYFAVPLDYLCGRCSLEDAQNMLDKYETYFNSIRRGTYEQYLMGNTHIKHFDINKYEKPYPYNLIYSIFGRADWVLTDRNLKAIDNGLNQLEERYREITIAYFKEHLTCDMLSRRYDVTKTRVNQIIDKSLRILRNPAISMEMRRGALPISEIEYLNEKLDTREKAIIHREEEIKKYEEEISKYINDRKPAAITPVTNATHLEELDLSIRSYNCLTRANIHTLTDLIGILDNGHIIVIRGMGCKSLNEVIDVINHTTNANYNIGTVVENAKKNGVGKDYIHKFMKDREVM